jgi:hypothetical protein
MNNKRKMKKKKKELRHTNTSRGTRIKGEIAN